MNRNEQAWQRLVAAARTASLGDDAAAPYGFATRVAARGLAAGPIPSASAVFEKFALRGLIAALACGAAAAAFGFSALSAEQEYEFVNGDLVTEVLAQS